MALLEFRARTDATLQDFITNAPRNACYTSKTIQNDIIELCGNYVREYTNAAVMKGGYFAIIADEVTDSSNNHTVLGICNRMLDISDPGNVFVKEQLFDFVQLERTNSESVCKKLMESYTLHSIDLNRVRAQTYDTTSSMSSAANGVNGQFRASYPKAMIDMICHPHLYNNPSLNDWAWDRETKDKANGIASCLNGAIPRIYGVYPVNFFRFIKV